MEGCGGKALLQVREGYGLLVSEVEGSVPKINAHNERLRFIL